MILCCILQTLLVEARMNPPGPLCLTGRASNVQNWVDDYGQLTQHIDKRNTIDLSQKTNSVTLLHQEISTFKSNRTVKMLSLAKCMLHRVPSIFKLKDGSNKYLYETLEYLTLYGNNFVDVSRAGELYDMTLDAARAIEIDIGLGLNEAESAVWAIGFRQITFKKLKELDLRNSNITTIPNGIFGGMVNLQALYLAENQITQVCSNAFTGLKILKHLDLSRNWETAMLVFDSNKVFSNLESLESMDFSFTKMSSLNIIAFQNLSRNFQRLSLCHTSVGKLPDAVFNSTSMKYLDISGNMNILNTRNPLKGIEDTLRVLYAEGISLKSLDIFDRFSKLEVLKVTNNEINVVGKSTASSLTNLQILDLAANRMTSWFTKQFYYMENLKYLSLKDNNVNMISEVMMEDFKNLSYLVLDGNFFVCNCYSRELFEVALRNELKSNLRVLRPLENETSIYSYHSGYENVNLLIKQRYNVSKYCDQFKCEESKNVVLNFSGNYLLVKADPSMYQCLQVSLGRSIDFAQVATCHQSQRGSDLEDIIDSGWTNIIILLSLIVILLPILIVTYIFRRNFKYCFITVRNSAMLSLINREDLVDDNTVFQYDVFVSYCNHDRGWVLDELLPHVEKNCNVRLCLHERDFKVGLSILENIVSCIDRSRSIMLILSKQFLLSQWCQFEMHLAQHRLLETRREDLVLVLLEDIPKRIRPTTLHYLMLTKTYIVWPQNESEHAAFWRRLKKSLVSDRSSVENVAFA